MPDDTLRDQLTAVCEFTTDSHHLVREMLTRIGDKWSISAIVVLAEGTHRFTELQDRIPGISHRVLTVVLRSLEADGLVARQDFGGVPRRVEYQLTSLGVSLLSPMLGLMAWADEHRDEIESSRSAASASSNALD